VSKLFKAVIYGVGVFVDEDDFVDSWRRECAHFAFTVSPIVEKRRSDGALVAGMANIDLASNDNPEKISFCEFQQAKTSSASGAIDKQPYSWISLSAVPVVVEWTCFDSRVLFDHFPRNWRLSRLTAGCCLIRFDALLLACSLPVYLSIAWDSKWKAVISGTSVYKQSWTTIKLRWNGSSNAAIMLNDSVTGSQRLRACRMRCFIDVTIHSQSADLRGLSVFQLWVAS